MIFLGFSDTIKVDMNNARRTEEKVFSFMEEHHMLKAGDRVVAGISGGADSLCLLFVLLEWAKRTPLFLAVVHVDHGLRQESGEDGRYVETLCRSLEIPFYLTRADVKARAERDKCSEEEAGRSIRYEAFSQAAEDFGAGRIAVAHNSNDLSETMLFHLFRGSGLKGLCGIPPVRDEIIRPILCLERPEIEGYLKERGISWRKDATNEEDDYTRNRIRHHILPYAENEIAPGCVARMSRTARILSETEDYLEAQTKEALKRCVRAASPGAAGEEAHKEGAFAVIDRNLFVKEHPAIRARMLHCLLKELWPGHKDMEYVHIQAMMTLFTQEGNRSVSLPFGMNARREYDKVILEKRAPQDRGAPSEDRGEFFPVFIGTGELGETPLRVGLGAWGEAELTLLLAEKHREVPQRECTKWFDYDKINKPLVFRTRQKGDYLTLSDGRGGQMHKSLKDYMITEKIPKDKRERILVLAQEHHVLWLAGWRISEYYKINGNTKRILQVQLRRDCGGSETEEGYGREH